MSEALISKKDLLETADISYGQLYRWKRKQLIPDEWFIRKSTFTGQETFFPKEKILPRIEKIKYYKEDLSLDALADLFSPSVDEFKTSTSDAISLISESTLELFNRGSNISNEMFTFENIVFLYIVDQCLKNGLVSRLEAKEIHDMLERYSTHFQDKQGEIIILRKQGVITLIMVPVQVPIFFDEQQNIVARYSLNTTIETLKALIQEGGKDVEKHS